MFLQKFPHICIEKIFFSVDLQIFWTFFIISKYLCNCYSHIISVLGLEKYSPCLLVQHIDNDKNVVVTSVESRVMAPAHRKIRKVECNLTFAARQHVTSHDVWLPRCRVAFTASCVQEP